MEELKIGLLPLYIELYDRMWPDIRKHMEGFLNTIEEELGGRGVRVYKGEVCRKEPEFLNVVKGFKELQVDAVVTLHLAYSPSLESARVLAGTNLPLIVLDTTPAFSFDGGRDPAEIDYNHGIHGVQDMCNLLLRCGKRFTIEAGHWRESDVLDRVVRDVKAAAIAARFRQSRVGLIGEPFRGMGDFAVPTETLEELLGIRTLRFSNEDARRYLYNITEDDIENEVAGFDRFAFSEELKTACKKGILNYTALADLLVRAWMEENRLSAFTANFMDVDRASGLPCMPFLEAGRAMADGKGYAGEGDVLTAALTGALASVFPETSFVEMFCPDWKGNRVFLSHTGEMNIALSKETPVLYEVEFPFTDAENPVAAYGRFKPGKAVFVNLAPGKDDTFSLIVACVEMEDVEEGDAFKNFVRGWFRPAVPLGNFLEKYSMAGGTHHAVLVYGDAAGAILEFGGMMGWKTLELRA